MQPENLAVELRPRSGWEAVDLGFRMVQAWWRPIYGALALVYLPPVAALAWLLHDQILLATLLLWWSKPLIERIPLYVVSEALFGREPTALETLRAWPRLLGRGGLASVTIGRFVANRAFSQPVRVLEGSSGARARERLRVLGRHARGTPLWLQFLCFHIEGFVLYLGALGLLAMLVPEPVEFQFSDLLVADGGVRGGLQIAIYGLCIYVVAPFYTAAGFSLYIHARVYLEGWDIDLAFRRMARRLAAATAALALALLAIQPATAQPPFERAEALLEDVFESPELRGWVEQEGWYLRDFETEPRAEDEEEAATWLTGLLGLLAEALRVLVIVAGVVALALLLAQLRRLRAPALRTPRDDDGVELVAGHAIARESLPEDVIAAARAEFADGRSREALSLLYRAALGWLVREVGVDLRTSQTEGQCLTRVRDDAPTSISGDFAELTRSWQATAWAGRAPAPEVFERLCARWDPHLRGATDAGRGTAADLSAGGAA